VREAMRCGLLDQITTPASQNRVEPGTTWCADNGIYSHAYPGNTRYLRWLGALPDPARCRFAVAPDVVGDHNATPDDIPWDYIDAVFLAGIAECTLCGFTPAVAELPMDTCPDGHPLTEWKTGAIASAIAAEGKARGKWIHMGRVNTRDRLLRAKAMGCDSADGTYLAYGPDRNLPHLLRWLCEPVQSIPQDGLFDLQTETVA
jgi:hypothetical protein